MPLLFITNSLLYIDPGTGSIILQAIAATIMGAGITIKLYWHRVSKFLGLRKSSDNEQSEKQEDNEA